MKQIVIGVMGLTLYSLAYAQDMKGMDMTKKPTITTPQPVTYTCIMHPQIHATKPGNCPICGMKLIKENSKNITQHPAIKKPDNKPIPVKDTLIKIDNKGRLTVHDTSHKRNEVPMQKTDDNPEKTIVMKISPAIVRYDLYVNDTVVNYTGKARHAIAINGCIPAPTLYFTEGDTAEIYV